MNSPVVRDSVICVWIFLVAVSFWGPYAGMALPVSLLTAVYALFLVLFVASAALHALRRGEKRPSDSMNTVSPAARSGTAPIPLSAEDDSSRGR